MQAGAALHSGSRSSTNPWAAWCWVHPTKGPSPAAGWGAGVPAESILAGHRVMGEAEGMGTSSQPNSSLAGGSCTINLPVVINTHGLTGGNEQRMGVYTRTHRRMCATEAASVSPPGVPPPPPCPLLAAALCPDPSTHLNLSLLPRQDAGPGPPPPPGADPAGRHCRGWQEQER